jgi:hypothetical protein
LASSLLFKIKSTFDNAGFREAQAGFKDTIGLLGKMAVLAASAVLTFRNLGAVIALVAAKKVLLDLPKFLFESVPAAAQAESAFARLKTQLGLLGLASTDNLKKVKIFADQTARSTQFSSEETQAAITIAIRRTGDLTKAIKQVAVAQDVAYATDRDLLTVTQLLNLAQAGNTRIIRQITNLRQQDIETAVRQGTLIDLLAKKFSGAAAQGAGTLAIKQQILVNTTRQLKEELGAVALPVNKFITDLRILGTNILLGAAKGTKEVAAATVQGTAGYIKLGAAIRQSIKDNSDMQKSLRETAKTFTFDFEKQFEINTLRLGATFDERRQLVRNIARANDILVIAEKQGTSVLTKEQLNFVQQFQFGQRKIQELISEETESERILGKARFDNLQKLKTQGPRSGLGEIFNFVESSRKANTSISDIIINLEKVNNLSPTVAKATAFSFGAISDAIIAAEKSFQNLKDQFALTGGKGLNADILKSVSAQIEDIIKTRITPAFNVQLSFETPPEAIQAAVRNALLSGLPGLVSAFTSAVKRGSQEQKANAPAV